VQRPGNPKAQIAESLLAELKALWGAPERPARGRRGAGAAKQGRRRPSHPKKK
jgi:hypothetical protein